MSKVTFNKTDHADLLWLFQDSDGAVSGLRSAALEPESPGSERDCEPAPRQCLAARREQRLLRILARLGQDDVRALRDLYAPPRRGALYTLFGDLALVAEWMPTARSWAIRRGTTARVALDREYQRSAASLTIERVLTEAREAVRRAKWAWAVARQGEDRGARRGRREVA